MDATQDIRSVQVSFALQNGIKGQNNVDTLTGAFRQGCQSTQEVIGYPELGREMEDLDQRAQGIGWIGADGEPHAHERQWDGRWL